MSAMSGIESLLAWMVLQCSNCWVIPRGWWTIPGSMSPVLRKFLVKEMT
jgi:hypothetical protein